MDDRLRRHLDDVASQCLHCGLCLPVCPTYSLTLREESSPRGRIRMLQALNNGSLALTENVVEEAYFCLDCQACQTACPAGVRYGTLIEEARDTIAEARMEPKLLRLVKRGFLDCVLRTPARTRIAAALLRFYRRSGLQDAVDSSGILNLFSERIAETHRLLPPVSERPFDDTVPEVLKPGGEPKGRVGFLTGCIMNVSFADVHRDAVDVLLANGFEVVIPRGQVCCGSLHAHNGGRETAKQLAAANIGAFSRHHLDAVVTDSAGCGAFMKEYGELFRDDPVLAGSAASLSRMTKDIMEFLAEQDLRVPGEPLRLRVTYHDACHLVHTQGISRQPRQVLSKIPGIELIELPESTWCCGSAGIYNILRYHDSVALLERKMQNVAATRATAVLASNPGCGIQMQYGARRFDVPVKVLHPVTLLAMAYRGQAKSPDESSGQVV